MRLAIEDATNVDAEQMILVTKKMEPRLPSGRSNLRLKKYVIQDLRDLACYTSYSCECGGGLTVMQDRTQMSPDQRGWTG